MAVGSAVLLPVSGCGLGGWAVSGRRPAKSVPQRVVRVGRRAGAGIRGSWCGGGGGGRSGRRGQVAQRRPEWVDSVVTPSAEDRTGLDVHDHISQDTSCA